MKRNKNWMFLLLLAGASTACLDNPIDPIEAEIIQETPALDETKFLSADPNNYQDNYRGDDGSYNNTTLDSSNEKGGDDRVVEEGDIYRVSSNAGIILNLNPYRGLQLIDFADPTTPEIVGQAQISGEPVEMYQVGDFVYILMNNWWGYYANQVLGGTERYFGGVVAVVDISDVTNPVIIKRAQIEGNIQASRLTRGNDKESLYVASSSNDLAYVKSFSLSETGDLISKDDIQLGGHVLDIQATGSHLLVSREVYTDNDEWVENVGSDIAVIDIRDENGLMIEGATVSVIGRVAKKSDMSMQGDILRVVSGNTWSSTTNANHVETFNYSDLQNPIAVDAKTFGRGEDLYATLFLGNAAFFVTFEQVDPFHSFSISDTGVLVEESEFIVSGFNTWFRPVSDNSRLIGIGVDDKNGNRSPAVSLYDIEDLKNRNPLVDREEVTTSWSNAIWDDKSFSVLEKSVSVMSDTGVLETGTVLLPFQGWDNSAQIYKTGVQIFTFSDTTLTKRGVMLHDTPVTRTFVADRSKDLTGNLSNLELSFYNTADVDAPTETSRLALAANYTKVLKFGNHIARRIDRTGYWNWWGSNNTSALLDTIEIVAKADFDKTLSVTEISIPNRSTLHKKDDLLIVVAQADDDITVSTWDLSDPTSPVLKDSLTTDSIPSNQYSNNVYYKGDDCYDCGYYYGETAPSKVIGNALVFEVDKAQEKIIGTVHTKSSYIDSRDDDCTSQACTYTRGYQNCTYLEKNDGTKSRTECDGFFERCTGSDTEDSCVPISAPANLEEYTDTQEIYHRWTQKSFHVVNLTDPTNLKLGAPIVSATTEESVSTLQEDNLLHFSFKIPQANTSPTRNLAAFYYRSLDFTDPSNVVVSADVNIPGYLVAADGNDLVTRGALWGVSGADETVNRLELLNGQAHLRGIKRFDQSYLGKVELSEDNKLYITYYNDETHLTVYPMTGAFTSSADVELEGWLSFEDTANNRVIFSVDGGVLVVNMEDLNNPYLQAFLPMRGWSNDFLLEGNELLIAAGLYGIYDFDITTSNLPTP